MKTEKINFTVVERIGLLNVIPSKGSFMTLMCSRKLKEIIDFNTEELATLELKEKEVKGQPVITWNVEAASEIDKKEFEVALQHLEIIFNVFEEANKKNELPANFFDLAFKIAEVLKKDYSECQGQTSAQ